MHPSRSRFKWAWIIYGSIGQRTGGYIYDRIIIEYLRAQGDEVHIVSLPPEPLSEKASALGLVARIHRLRPDAVVGDELCYRELSIALSWLPQTLVRAVLVHHLHAWETEEPALQRARIHTEQRALMHSDLLITTSPFTHERLLQLDGLPPCHTVEPGADRLPILSIPRQPDGKHRLISVGSLIPRKRQLELLFAFEKAGVAGAELVLVGDFYRDFAYFDRIRAALRSSAYLQRHVILRGLVSDLELSELFSSSDGLILASSLEGYGMVLSEATFAGTPILCTRAGAPERRLRHGAEAWVCDTSDELPHAIQTFLSNAPLREHMRSCAREQKPRLPTWQKAGSHLRSLLAEAVQRRRSESSG